MAAAVPVYAKVAAPVVPPVVVAPASTTLPYTLDAAGNVAFSKKVTFGDVAMNGSTTIQNATVNGGLNVVGQTTLTGLSLTQQLTVQSLTVNDTLQAGAITATGSLTSNGTTNLNGSTIAGGITADKIVSPDIEVAANVNGNEFYAPVVYAGADIRLTSWRQSTHKDTNSAHFDLTFQNGHEDNLNTEAIWTENYATVGTGKDQYDNRIQINFGPGW